MPRVSEVHLRYASQLCPGLMIKERITVPSVITENPRAQGLFHIEQLMRIWSIWAVIYALRSHFGQSFAYDFNQIKPSLSVSLAKVRLRDGSLRGLFWQEIQGSSHTNTVTKPDDTPGRGLNVVKAENKLKSFPLPLLMLRGFACLTKMFPKCQ